MRIFGNLNNRKNARRYANLQARKNVKHYVTPERLENMPDRSANPWTNVLPIDQKRVPFPCQRQICQKKCQNVCQKPMTVYSTCHQSKYMYILYMYIYIYIYIFFFFFFFSLSLSLSLSPSSRGRKKAIPRRPYTTATKTTLQPLKNLRFRGKNFAAQKKSLQVKGPLRQAEGTNLTTRKTERNAVRPPLLPRL